MFDTIFKIQIPKLERRNMSKRKVDWLVCWLMFLSSFHLRFVVNFVWGFCVLNLIFSSFLTCSSCKKCFNYPKLILIWFSILGIREPNRSMAVELGNVYWIPVFCFSLLCDCEWFDFLLQHHHDDALDYDYRFFNLWLARRLLALSRVIWFD